MKQEVKSLQCYKLDIELDWIEQGLTHSTVIGSTIQARGSCCKCEIDVTDRPSLRKSVVRAALRPDLFWGSLLALPDNMQMTATSLHTGNHTKTSSLIYLQA